VPLLDAILPHGTWGCAGDAGNEAPASRERESRGTSVEWTSFAARV
jgi:hypothetical protein